MDPLSGDASAHLHVPELPGKSLQRLRDGGRLRKFQRGHIVFHEGDPGDSVYVASSGHFVMEATTPAGDSVSVVFLSPGEIFGILGVIVGQGRRVVAVRALDDAAAIVISREGFERIRAEEPELTDVLLKVISKRLHDATQRMLELVYVPAKLRVVRTLVRLARYYGESEGRVEIPLNQSDLASLAGTSRDTVNRTLAAEVRRGVLEVGRARVMVANLESLQARAARTG